MPKKSADVPEYVGAPPASESGFAFANGEFFAEAAGQNRHRRATLTELKEKIASGSDKDHPAHWFEAQLLHYGLRPSKTKSVARMRLFDAVNTGDLAVPDHISKLEKKLKTAWTKSEREAKKKATTPVVKKSTATTTAGVKRKAAPDKSTPRSKPAAGQPAAKKTKSTPSKSDETTPAKPKTKQTAKRGGIAAGGPSRSAPRQTESPAMPKQTARRGGSRANGRNSSSSLIRQGFTPNEISTFGNEEDPPPPYSVVRDDDLPPLGLLNGDYVLRSPYVTEEWPRLGTQFQLTLTISGRQLWGRFDLGVIEGVMHFPERPWISSNESVPFTWRGREDEGPICYGDRNHGEVRFLGGGAIEGEFDYQGISFHGRRIPDQGTRSSINASRMEQEWDGYNEERYEEENGARWF